MGGQENLGVEQVVEEKRPQRVGLWIGAIVVVIMLLGAAAFVGVRMGLLGMLPGQRSAMGGLPPGQQGMGIELNMTPAPELPTVSPEVVGMYSRQDGSSVFINEANDGGVALSSVGPGAGPAGGVNSAKPATGKEIEVVITRETKIYMDVTDMPQPSGDSGMQVLTVQQKVEQITSLDGLKEDTPLRVWGERRGDRVIATVILYVQMITFSS